VWLDYYLSSGSPKVPEKLLLSSLEGSNLVPTAPAPGMRGVVLLFLKGYYQSDLESNMSAKLTTERMS
jgi:hypothetical protein